MEGRPAVSRGARGIWIWVALFVVLAVLLALLASLMLQPAVDAAPVGTGDSWMTIQQLLWPYTGLRHNGQPPVWHQGVGKAAVASIDIQKNSSGYKSCNATLLPVLLTETLCDHFLLKVKRNVGISREICWKLQTAWMLCTQTAVLATYVRGIVWDTYTVDAWDGVDEQTAKMCQLPEKAAIFKTFKIDKCIFMGCLKEY